jgi:hypothetical protein
MQLKMERKSDLGNVQERFYLLYLKVIIIEHVEHKSYLIIYCTFDNIYKSLI